MDTISQDSLIGSFVTLEEAKKEVGRITNAYKNEDIDLTILLTHIGYESDIELAEILDPIWGVDLIIGGHSHTILDKPTLVNNILITQAGVGTDQVGRFDIVVDDATNSIIDYQWQLIPINEDLCEPDKELQKYINSFKEEVDRKYNTILSKFAHELTHPEREIETSLGNLFADAIAESMGCDVMLLGSGSIRVEKLGPLVTLKDFLSSFPYDDTLTNYKISGKKLERIFSHIMRPENRDGEGECYQVNSKVRAIYNDTQHKLISLKLDDEPVDYGHIYSICAQNYHINNSERNLDLTYAELTEDGMSRVVSTSAQEVLEEYLRYSQNLSRKTEGRLQFLE
jgi:5'-nucleotidase